MYKLRLKSGQIVELEPGIPGNIKGCTWPEDHEVVQIGFRGLDYHYLPARGDMIIIEFQHVSKAFGNIWQLGPIEEILDGQS